MSERNSSLVSRALEIPPGLAGEVRTNVTLSEYTTFRLGGTVPYVITCRTPQELEDVVQFLAEQKFPFILLGGGSNLVVSDEGLDCAVVRYVSETPVIERRGNVVKVSGSTSLDALALYAAENGLQGINYCSGIPGTVGGAVVGNAGAFGKQIGDVLASVLLLNPASFKRTAGREDLQFSYRHSALKETDDIVVSVELALQPGDREQLLKERTDTLALRASKHPDLKVYPCAGSFFRNIEPTSKAGHRQAAGWFLEQAGAKDLRRGGAVIFEKHANIIVKADGCKAQHIYELSQDMARLVKEKFNLELVREVRFVGKFAGMPEENSGKVMW